MNEKRETVGKIATDLQQKHEVDQSPIDIQQEVHKDYEKNFFECLKSAQKDFPNSDVYIIVETKKERLLHNVIRNFFYYRQSCPTPAYDTAVYRYVHADERIDFLWVVPSKDTCELLRDNALHVDAWEKELLGFVLAFYDGTLLQKAKQLNGESSDSLFLEKR